MAEDLTLTGVDVGYRSRRSRNLVISNVTAHARAGEVTVLLGRNGAGKSTLLRTVIGLIPALTGSIMLGDSDIAAMSAAGRARCIAAVLTNPVDAGLIRGYDVVALGRYPHTGSTGRLDTADRAVIDDAINAVQVGDLVDKRLGELSDGERQRIFIARAVAQQPQLLVLDEPSAYLDVAARVSLFGLLHRLAADGVCVVASTHDLESALRFADQTWLVDAALPEGVHSGAPDQLIEQGHLNAVFDTDELRFDASRRVFDLRWQP